MLKPYTPDPGLRYYYPLPAPDHRLDQRADVVVYGGTSCGVVAACHAASAGKHVVLLVFGRHVGGMTSGGLGATDIGNKQAIGGISRSFYRRLGKHYGQDEAWHFEPHVAEQTFSAMLEEAGVEVHFEQRITRVVKDGTRVIALETEGGHRFAGRVFIDAGYEGDLMAAAGVSYHVGREANSFYRETLNGVHFGHPNHRFAAFVSPFNVENDPASGLLPGVQNLPAGRQGEGDACVQAYNFRMCFARKPENQRPVPRPEAYDPRRYELLRRYIAAGVFDPLDLTIDMPGCKTDTNNHGAFSSDHVGANWAWPEADLATRERIFQDHVSYQSGLYYFLANDERLPGYVREKMNRLQLPRDEFVETGGWPHELYVREGRRMVSDLVMREQHCTFAETVAEPIGMAAYQLDSHNCRRLAIDGRAVNEGNVEVEPTGPYPIGYAAIRPRGSECTNLLVPWCLSASHIAFGSIRMEPVGMVTGQSAAAAACLAVDRGTTVQEVPYPKLRDVLEREGQVLGI